MHVRRGHPVAADLVIRAKHYVHFLTPDTPLNADLQTSDLRELEFDLHQGIEFGVVLRGQQRRVFEGLSYLARPGDVWLVPTWEPHGWEVTRPDTRTLVLIFLPEFLGEEQLGGVSWLALFAAPPAYRPRVVSKELRARVLSIAGEIWQEVERKSVGWQDAVRHGLLQALLMLRRGWEAPSFAPGGLPRLHASNLKRIMPVMTALHNAPSRRVTIPEAAAACGLSTSRFKRVFRDTMGLSFGQFCLRARTAFAAHLLATTDLPGMAIAQQSGFADASHLHRTFVKQYACTPALYRRRFKAGPLSRAGD